MTRPRTRSRANVLGLLTVLLAPVLAGCAGAPPRAGDPGAVRQPTGVLEALQAYQPKAGRGDPRPASEKARRPSGPRAARAAPEPTAAAPGAAIPGREPARVLRIWIAPWEDAAGNLHGASDVFTEIRPRRWRISPAGAPAGTVPTPLQIEPRRAAGPGRTPEP